MNCEDWWKENHNKNRLFYGFEEEPHFNLGFLSKALLCKKEAKLPVIIENIKKHINRSLGIAIFEYEKNNITSYVIKNISNSDCIYISDVKFPKIYENIDSNHKIHQLIEEKDYFI